MYHFVVAILAVLLTVAWWKNRAIKAELTKVRTELEETESQLSASRKLSRAVDGERQNIASKYQELAGHVNTLTTYGMNIAPDVVNAHAFAKKAKNNADNHARSEAAAKAVAELHAHNAAHAQAKARASAAKNRELEAEVGKLKAADIALDQVIDRLVGSKRGRSD